MFVETVIKTQFISLINLKEFHSAQKPPLKICNELFSKLGWKIFGKEIFHIGSILPILILRRTGDISLREVESKWFKLILI